MREPELLRRGVETLRHRTAWLEAGPADGALMIFLHGWPMLGLVWRRQIESFARLGWRCVAPDMRGYGGSSVPERLADYAVRELVADMVELHQALGGRPAVWVGHDWGAAVVWALAAHHPDRCTGVVALCVPYLARGFALPVLVPLVDRTMYPENEYPVGQWDYWLYYRESFEAAARQLGDDPAATVSALFRPGPPDAVGKPARTAGVRARGGWFEGGVTRLARDHALLGDEAFDALVEAFQTNGFHGANAWYLNDAENLAYAAQAPSFGRIGLPALFIHSAWDTVCETIRSRLAEPMRSDCANLIEAVVEGGHSLMLERPTEVEAAIAEWLGHAI